jgi:hypothetical protein
MAKEKMSALRRGRCVFDENLECPSVLDCCDNGCTEHPEMLDPEAEMDEP